MDDLYLLCSEIADGFLLHNDILNVFDMSLIKFMYVNTMTFLCCIAIDF